MKYSISGFRQDKALEFRMVESKDGEEVITRLDCTDLVILRWLTDYYPMIEKLVTDSGLYAMVNCKMIVDNLPLLGLSDRDVLSRLSKMVKFEILGQYLLPTKRVLNLNNLGAEVLYLFFGKNYKLLLCD